MLLRKSTKTLTSCSMQRLDLQSFAGFRITVVRAVPRDRWWHGVGSSHDLSVKLWLCATVRATVGYSKRGGSGGGCLDGRRIRGGGIAL